MVYKKILITGGAGFIGLHLANRLLDEGCKVHIVDNFSRAVNDLELKRTLDRKHSTMSSINLLDERKVFSLEKDFDIIFHLAAIIGVKHVLEKPYKVLYDNVRMLGAIVELARRQHKLSRFFFSSTSEVYAGTLEHFGLPLPTPETTPLATTNLSHPRTSYMLSKIYGEALCQHSGLPYTLFRPHNIYGPRMGISHVIPEQLKKAFEAGENDCIEVYSVDHTRCFCYIDDAVEIIWRMIESSDCENKTLNLGAESPEVTMRELAEICYSIVGKDLRVKEGIESPGSPVRRCADMSKTQDIICFEPIVDLHRGISETYDWYSKNVFLGDEITAI